MSKSTGFMSGLKKILLGNETDTDEYDGYEDRYEAEYDDRDYYETEPAPRSHKPTVEGPSNIVNIRDHYTGKHTEMILAKPADLDGAASVCSNVCGNKACVVNLEGIHHDTAQRIADFISGAVYSVGGEMERVSDEIFVVAPATVHISSSMKSELKKGGKGFFKMAANPV